MADQIFLIAPDAIDAEAFTPKLKAALSTAQISGLFLPLGGRSDADYTTFVKAIAPLAQAEGTAVILDNRPDLVEILGADGVHVTGGAKALRDAVSALKPDFIVGTGDINSRHEAMVRGELDIDYLLFGDRDESDAEMADWWAETFEIPSVYLAAGTADPALGTIGTEFVALGGEIWDAPEALANIAGTAE